MTWDNVNGLRAYVNGKLIMTKAVGIGTTIPARGRISVGQEQDCEAGCFDSTQAYYGSMTELYMWDHALNADEVNQLYKGVQKDGWIFGFDQCQLGTPTKAVPVQGGIVYASRVAQGFPPTRD